MDTAYPASASALRRGRRALRSRDERARRHTQPVTFAEIKEVDEDNEELQSTAAESTEVRRRRRRDILRGARRRSRDCSPALREADCEAAAVAAPPPPRARSQPDLRPEAATATTPA